MKFVRKIKNWWFNNWVIRRCGVTVGVSGKYKTIQEAVDAGEHVICVLPTPKEK